MMLATARSQPQSAVNSVARLKVLHADDVDSGRAFAKGSLGAPADISAANPFVPRDSQDPLPLRKLWAALFEDERAAVEAIVARQARPIGLRDLIATNPTRPPGWRWQGALLWLRSGLPNWPSNAFKPFGHAARLLIAAAPAWVEPPPFVGIHACLAAEISRWLGPNSAELRVALESLVLADVPPDEIARELALPRYTVDLYEKQFFDVRSRLAATSFVVHASIGTPSADELLSVAMHRERRRLSYFGGPWVARELNRPVIDLPRPTNPKEAEAFLAADARRQIERQGQLVLRSLSPDKPKHGRMILHIWLRLELAEARARVRAGHAEVNRWRDPGALTAEESKEAMGICLGHFKGLFRKAGEKTVATNI